MMLGILSGLAAGALWGLTFIAPLAVAPYQPIDVVIVRSLVFGLLSATILGARGFRDVKALPRDVLWSVFLFGAIGFNLYFALMAMAVPLIGAAIVALVIGALPVAMALAGNTGPDRIEPRRLAPPLTAIAVGLVVVNGAALGGHGGVANPAGFALGLALTVASFLAWFWYAMRNAALLRGERVNVDAWTWTLLCGLGTLTSLPLLILPALALGLTAIPRLGIGHEAFGALVFWGTLVGVASSIVATWLWSIASRRLPVSLAAQLIVSETVFALLFGFVHAGRGPSVAEAIAAVLLIGGVTGAVRAFQRR